MPIIIILLCILYTLLLTATSIVQYNFISQKFNMKLYNSIAIGLIQCSIILYVFNCACAYICIIYYNTFMYRYYMDTLPVFSSLRWYK